MPPDIATGSYDNVAQAAVLGVAPVVIAVCADPHEATTLVEWLQIAIPAFAPVKVRTLHPDDLIELVTQAEGVEIALLVGDASGGADEVLRGRWVAWNTQRERIAGPGRSPCRPAVILVTTRVRMAEVSNAAPDLLSVAHVITVSGPDFTADGRDRELLGAYHGALHALEERYGLGTDEIVRRIIAREPIAVPPTDLERWKAAIDMVRGSSIA